MLGRPSKRDRGRGIAWLRGRMGLGRARDVQITNGIGGGRYAKTTSDLFLFSKDKRLSVCCRCLGKEVPVGPFSFFSLPRDQVSIFSPTHAPFRILFYPFFLFSFRSFSFQGPVFPSIPFLPHQSTPPEHQKSSCPFLIL